MKWIPKKREGKYLILLLSTLSLMVGLHSASPEYPTLIDYDVSNPVTNHDEDPLDFNFPSNEIAFGERADHYWFVNAGTGNIGSDRVVIKKHLDLNDKDRPAGIAALNLTTPLSKTGFSKEISSELQNHAMTTKGTLDKAPFNPWSPGHSPHLGGASGSGPLSSIQSKGSSFSSPGSSRRPTGSGGFSRSLSGGSASSANTSTSLKIAENSGSNMVASYKAINPGDEDWAPGEISNNLRIPFPQAGFNKEVPPEPLKADLFAEKTNGDNPIFNYRATGNSAFSEGLPFGGSPGHSDSSEGPPFGSGPFSGNPKGIGGAPPPFFNYWLYDDNTLFGGTTLSGSTLRHFESEVFSDSKTGSTAASVPSSVILEDKLSYPAVEVITTNSNQELQGKVPEPTTVILYGLGFAGAGLYIYIRKRK